MGGGGGGRRTSVAIEIWDLILGFYLSLFYPRLRSLLLVLFKGGEIGRTEGKRGEINGGTMKIHRKNNEKTKAKKRGKGERGEEESGVAAVPPGACRLARRPGRRRRGSLEHYLWASAPAVARGLLLDGGRGAGGRRGKVREGEGEGEEGGEGLEGKVREGGGGKDGRRGKVREGAVW